ncbi:MAG TPA: ABC transporter permease, partial [Fibrobacteria bacterium]|nr:ABC transporter permease [Fibrobacteria bacterium]
LRIHERNRSGVRGHTSAAPESGPGEDEDNLDMLKSPGSGEGGSLGPAASAVTGGTSAKGVLSRLEEDDEELDMLEEMGTRETADGAGATLPAGTGDSSTRRGVGEVGGAEAAGRASEVTSAAGPEDAGVNGGEGARRPHYLGTDRNGHDLLALLVAGARTCFIPGLVTCAVALGLGIPLGLLAGYYGGRFSKAVHTLNGIVLSLPRLVLILVVICALEPNVYYTMAVLGVTLIPRVSELIATRVRILSNMGFILAAKEAALSDFKILNRHLFWYQNRAVFFIQFSLIMAESILVETTLSYLQFGTKPPEVSWGNIIEGSQMSFFSGFYWITFFPAAAIILAILGFFYLGDGLNARLAWQEGR